MERFDLYNLKLLVINVAVFSNNSDLLFICKQHTSDKKHAFLLLPFEMQICKQVKGKQNDMQTKWWASQWWLTW